MGKYSLIANIFRNITFFFPKNYQCTSRIFIDIDISDNECDSTRDVSFCLSQTTYLSEVKSEQYNSLSLSFLCENMATTVTNNGNQQELHSIQQQIHEKKTGILDSTRRMLGLISESEAVGNSTAAVRQFNHSFLSSGLRAKSSPSEICYIIHH